MVKVIKVLSIDGGGIYGIISARVLSRIEELTGKQTAKLFDFIAGTSTGGIITLGLTLPDSSGEKPKYQAKDLVHLYETKGSQIFSRSLLHELRALGNLIDQKYDSQGIDQTLQHFFGDAKLSETLTEVLVTSYDIERKNPHFFKRHKALKNPDRNFYLRDAARATSAAPTYFEPAKIRNISKTDSFALVDGGVFANNPAMCAYAEVKSMYPQVEKIVLVSLGTSSAEKPYRYNKAKDWGAAQWIVPLLDVVYDGVADSIDYELQHIFLRGESLHNSYERLVPVTSGNIAFDDASPESVQTLLDYADKFIETNDMLFRTVCEQLT